MKIKFTGVIDWPDEPDDRGTVDHEIGSRICQAFLEESEVEYEHTTGKFYLHGKEIPWFDEGTYGWDKLNFSWEIVDENL